MARKREKGPLFWRGAIVTMLASVFGVFAVAAFHTSPALDTETACRMDHKDPAHTVILLDQSDPFNANDLGWVREFVDAEARSLPKHGRLTVMTPNHSDPYNPNEVFVHCSPGAAADANPILQNPRMIENAWQSGFYQPLIADVETALRDDEKPSSPLFEAIYSIADRADFQHARKDRRLVIVSDLMQHSDSFSMYRTGADYSAFGETKLAGQIPDMAGIDVVARIVPRQDYDLPLSDVKSFWRTYFSEAGASYGSVN